MTAQTEVGRSAPMPGVPQQKLWPPLVPAGLAALGLLVLLVPYSATYSVQVGGRFGYEGPVRAYCGVPTQGFTGDVVPDTDSPMPNFDWVLESQADPACWDGAVSRLGLSLVLLSGAGLAWFFSDRRSDTSRRVWLLLVAAGPVLVVLAGMMLTVMLSSADNHLTGGSFAVGVLWALALAGACLAGRFGWRLPERRSWQSGPKNVLFLVGASCALLLVAVALQLVVSGIVLYDTNPIYLDGWQSRSGS